MKEGHFKDARLHELARRGNVAQFVSFSPDLKQRFSRVLGFEPNHKFKSTSLALAALLQKAPENRINLRSFKPDDPQGHRFLYGIRAVDEAARELRSLARSGLFVIANETVDVADGGVSGVCHGNVMEFAPGVTPRVVESGHVASVTRSVGMKLLTIVYGFGPELPDDSELRIEFSLHPRRRGFRNDHTILWESERAPSSDLMPALSWPNRFSEYLGDKAFGLLFAHVAGLRVPKTLVLSRVLPPFCFGDGTGSDAKWLRTCPERPEPGFFPTVRGWTDPFKLLGECPGRERVASILVQDEVAAVFSGAVITATDSRPIIEGVPGFGDEFMLGRAGPAELGHNLRVLLENVHRELRNLIGSARIEWVYDGIHVWLIQVQQEPALTSGRVIVAGDVDKEVDFDVNAGLPGLRELVSLLKGSRTGIRLIGDIGVTSHLADVLRRHRVPSRVVRGTAEEYK